VKTLTDRRPSAVLVFSVVVLIIALSSTSYAAVKLSKNSVYSKHIKNGQVKSADIGNGQVRGADVAEASLGQVPSAAAAANADALGGVAAASYVNTNVMLRWGFGLHKGDPNTTFTWGPLTFTFTCTNDGGDPRSIARLTTSVDNLWVDTSDGDDDYDFDVAEGSLDWSDYSTSSVDSYQNEKLMVSDPAGGFSVFTDGYHVGTWVNHVGYDCWYDGYLVNNAA
jgi:hypothetical protein